MDKNKSMKTVALVVKKIAGTMADIAYGTASVCGMHQPKEPAKKDKM